MIDFSLNEQWNAHTVHTPTTPRELWNYVSVTFNIQIPYVRVCPGHRAPFEAFAHAYFARDSMSIWKASRGLGGKSMLLALLALTEMTTLGASVTLLGGSGQQSQRVHQYMTGADPNSRGKFWQAPGAPRGLLVTEPSATETKLENGGYLKTLMASQTSVRGAHPTRLRMDECKLGSTNIYTYEHGKQRIKDVVPGTLVFGWNGCSFDVGIVSANRCNGVRNTLRIKLSNGKSLYVTANDLVLTKAGWKNAGEINAGESVVGMSEVQYADATREAIEGRVHGPMLAVHGRGKRQEGASLLGLRKKVVGASSGPMHAMPKSLCRSREKALRGLWDPSGGRLGPLPTVQFQDQAKSSTSLRGLWHATEAKYKAMPTVLPEDHADRRIPGGTSKRVCGAASVGPDLSGVGVGVRSEASAGFNGAEMGCPGTYGTVYRGSVRPIYEVGHRGIHWMDLKWNSEQGSEAEKDSVSTGERVPCALSSRFSEVHADVVFPDPIYHRVVSIEKGPTEEVYDLTVPGLSSFVAEGVVVHNCDEMSFDIWSAAQGQTMASRGVAAQTVMSSTHQYPDGTMTEILKMADERGWPIWEWCFRENLAPHGWLDPAEVERKKNEVPAAMWRVEFELQEPSPENRAIDEDAVKALFDPKLGTFPGAPDKQIVVIKPGHGEYYHGCDWAKTQDWTVIHSMWRNPKGPDLMAAWARTGRRPWPSMIGMLNGRVKRYGGACTHDATGVGNVCADYLDIESEGFDFRAVKQRQEMLTDYIAAIERGDMRYPLIAWMKREHQYATYNDLYGSGHLPDSISAGAMAWRARNYGGDGDVLGVLDR